MKSFLTIRVLNSAVHEEEGHAISTGMVEWRDTVL